MKTSLAMAAIILGGYLGLKAAEPPRFNYTISNTQQGKVCYENGCWVPIVLR